MKPKYIPLEKRSKSQQKEYHAKKRRDWGEISPVTKKTVNKKVYDRKKSARWSQYDPPGGFFGYAGFSRFWYSNGTLKPSRGGKNTAYRDGFKVPLL